MDMSVIFISEFISSQALETLKARHNVIYEPEAYQNPDKMAENLVNADAWIVRNLTKVNEALINGAKQLKVVGRLGVGLENIDLPVCSNKNITVIPATGANALSVAEYVLGTSMALIDRKSTCLNSSHVSESRMPSSA